MLAGLLLQRPINHDAGWYLYAAEAMLNGKRLYIDLIDVNPPMIFLLHMPPVIISDVCGYPVTTIFNCFFLGLLACSLLLCNYLLNQCLGTQAARPRRFIIVALIFILMPFEMPWNCFGQREHIMCILVLPYIFSTAAWLHGYRGKKPFLFLLGILAGIGFALKPHFLIVYLVVEMYTAFARDWKSVLKRPESLGILLFQTIHWLYIIIAMPEYKEAVFMIMPAYESFTDPVAKRYLAAYAVLFGCAVLAWASLFRCKHYKNIGSILFLTFSSFGILALIQQKGWHYHLYPVSATAAILITLGIVRYASLKRKNGLLRGIAASALVLLFFLLTFFKMLPFAKSTNEITHPLAADLSSLIPVVRQHADHKFIYVFSSSVPPGFPLTNYTQTQWASRFNCLWFLPAFYRDVPLDRRTQEPFPYTPVDTMSPTERFFMQKLLSDIINKAPKIIIVDKASTLQGFGKTTFKYIDYFSQDPRFVAFWKNYDFLCTIGTYDVYKKIALISGSHTTKE